jgi:hypothetical protein
MVQQMTEMVEKYTALSRETAVYVRYCSFIWQGEFSHLSES